MDEYMNQPSQPAQPPRPEQQTYQQPQGAPNAQQPGGYYPPQNAPYQPAYTAPKKKKIAVVLAFFLGALGIHKFYMGKTMPGIIALLVSLIGSIFTLGLAFLVMEVISIIECLFYLCMTEDEWQRTYITGPKDWF